MQCRMQLVNTRDGCHETNKDEVEPDKNNNII